MTNRAVDALRADRDVLVALGQGLDEGQWKDPSGCAGWSVQDLYAHLSTLFWTVVDRSNVPDTRGVPTEQAQEVNVQSRRAWASDAVLAEYADVSTRALDKLAELEQADFVLPLGDLGTYHVSVLPNAFTFDHYTHLRADLFAPRGPLPGPLPPSDELRLVPTLDWVEAALPQQNAELWAQLPGAVELVVTGTAARTIVAGEGQVVARVESSADALVRWATQRGSWAELGVQATGDEAALGTARRLNVL
jgi:uncharacterized protein (TIGR03083 family)